MKRLFILWSLLISFVHGVEINEDITDIYFGNGVWNDSETAKNGRDELSRKILWSVYNGNIQTFKKRHYAVRDSAEANENIILLSYNWTGVSPETGAGNIDEYFGFFWDIVEIFDQLQREGQLPYFSFFGWLQHSEHSIIREWLDNYFISIDGANLEDMLNRYKTISFTKGHRVLLVSHSQGGKFANRVYDTLTPTWYKDYFANLQVASPASSVHALKGAYVTFRGDKLINSIPGSMEGNADLNPEDDVLFDLNHEFVSEYLRQTDSLRQILENIPALLLALDRTYSQWLIKTENINTHICEERRAELIHFQESLTIPTAFPFRIDSVDVNGTKRYLGKAYPLDVNGIKKYVFASEDGELIIDVEDQNIILDDMSNDVGCYLLDGTEDQIVKGCGDANVTEGVLEVDLSWKSPAIDLELTVFKEGEDGAGDVEIVSYDTFDETCPKEHWFIENEADVQAGTYVVHITTQDTTNIDEALLPETIKLKIDAPGGGLKISINIPSTDLLNIGAVAKIIITKPEGGIRVAVEVTEHPDLEYAGERYQYDKDGKVYNYEVVSLLNRIELGPIANAQIEIMSLVATDFGQIVYNGYTSSGDTLDTNGLMLLPSSFKQSVASDGLYLISATGGEDVDTDDDLNMDATPTSNFGSIHAIVSGAAIKENGLKVNILTELGYQVSKHLLLNSEDAVGALTKLDEAAQALLNRDMNNDSTIDHADLHAWVPSFDKAALLFNYNSKIHPIVLKIYNADDIYDDAYNLIYPNTRPTANAGDDINISPDESVTLDGSGSYDSDGYIAEYIWSEGTTYCSGSTPLCTIDGLTAGSHTFELIVKDNNGAIARDRVEVTVNMNASLIGSINTADYAYDIALSPDGTILYVANNYSGIAIIDVSNPAAPTMIGSYDTSLAREIVLSADGNTAYVADAWSGLQIIDVSDPASPRRISTYDTPGFAKGLTLSKDGSIVYVADHTGGLQIINIVNPALPVAVGYSSIRMANKVTLSHDGSVAYVSDWDSGLVIVDVSSSSSPRRIGNYRLGFAEEVALSLDGTVAYVVDSALGLRILDVSDPVSPSLISAYNATLNYPKNVILSADGTVAYLSDITNGLQIIDVSNPSAPLLMGNFDTIGSMYSIVLSSDGTIGYIADGSSGVHIVDLSAFAR